MTIQSASPKSTRSLICILFLCTAAVPVLSGCALFAKKPPPMPSSSSPAPKQQTRPQPKSGDSRAQKQFYDLGVQHYSKENYNEARSAFQQAVDLGPDTMLGQKAQENLRKIQQILKTLEEIESK